MSNTRATSRVLPKIIFQEDAQAGIAGDRFAREGVELVVCYVGTYSTSGQVLPTVQRARAPVLILNLQPACALDYTRTDTGEWLANCCACCVPEIACAFARSRIDFHVVTGALGVPNGKQGRPGPTFLRPCGRGARFPIGCAPRRL